METQMTDTPQLKTALPGPKARAIIDRDRVAVSPSYTRSYPFVMARGSGAMVEDVDGNVFLDCAAGIAVNSTGHSHPDVVAAITEQAGRFLHMSGTDFYYDEQVRLAEAIGAVVPIDGGVRSFFGNSGAEAIEACIKLARYATGRPNLIAFLGSFHGRTMGALALTASKAVQRRGFAPLMSGVYHAPYADCYRCPLGLRPESCSAECLDFIEHQLLVHLVSPDELAAIVVEPIQGEGGYIVAPDQFLERLRELTRQHGILLVVDEVQSGMGRTGKMFAIEFTRRASRHDRDCQGRRLRPAARRGGRTGRSDGMAARGAREHVRRQPGVVRGGARDDQAAEGTARRQRRRRRGLPPVGPDRPHGQTSAHRGRAGPRADDRRRAGARSAD